MTYALPLRKTAAIERATRTWLGKLALFVFVGAMAYLVLMPLIRVQMLSLSDGAAGYRDAFRRPGFAKVLWTTVKLALGALTISMVLGTGLAVAAANLPRRLRFLRVAPILPLVVPFIAAIVGWTALLSPRPGYLNILLRRLPWWSDLTQGPLNIYSINWIIIITGLALTSYVYLFVSAGLTNINSELLEAARSSGSGPITVFFRITLPLLRPVLIYGGAVALLLGLGQFTAPLLLGRSAGIEVITTQMYYFTQAQPVNYAAAAAIASPLIVFGLLIVLGQRWVLSDQARFVTHGAKAFKAAGQGSYLAATAISAFTFVAVVLPTLGLLYLSFSPFWRPVLTTSHLTLDNYRQVRETDNLTAGIRTSLVCSITAVAIALPVGFAAALIQLKGRGPRALRWLTDLLVTLPLGVPPVVFGVGFLYTYSREPFVLYGTTWVIILVYVTLMLPFSTRMQLSAMAALGNAYEEASRVSGAGTLRTYARVIFPLIRPALGGAAALMFVLLTHEFTASVLVRSPTTQVMGTALFDFWTNGSYPLVAAMAIVMAVITSIGVTAAMLLSGGKAFDNL